MLKLKKIRNVDITVILERPKLKVYKEKIAGNICKILKLSRNKVNLKVKSQEKLMPAGRECIICLSIVNIR